MRIVREGDGFKIEYHLEEIDDEVAIIMCMYEKKKGRWSFVCDSSISLPVKKVKEFLEED